MEACLVRDGLAVTVVPFTEAVSGASLVVAAIQVRVHSVFTLVASTEDVSVGIKTSVAVVMTIPLVDSQGFGFIFRERSLAWCPSADLGDRDLPCLGDSALFTVVVGLVGFVSLCLILGPAWRVGALVTGYLFVSVARF